MALAKGGTGSEVAGSGVALVLGVTGNALAGAPKAAAGAASDGGCKAASSACRLGGASWLAIGTLGSSSRDTAAPGDRLLVSVPAGARAPSCTVVSMGGRDSGSHRGARVVRSASGESDEWTVGISGTGSGGASADGASGGHCPGLVAAGPVCVTGAG